MDGPLEGGRPALQRARKGAGSEGSAKKGAWRRYGRALRARRRDALPPRARPSPSFYGAAS